MNYVKNTVKCGRLYKSYCRWFREKRLKKIEFSYRFTGLESKRFWWNFAYAIQELLNVESLSKTNKVKLHALAYAAIELRDATSTYIRVEVNRDLLKKLFLNYKSYFNAYSLFLGPLRCGTC